jgi:serine/threonine protein kinase
MKADAEMNGAHCGAARNKPSLGRKSELSRGDRLGRYEIRSLLGSGGMGVVYRAHDTRLARDVAVKVLPQALAADPERLSRFEREVRVASALSDPHIVAVFDAGREGAISYFVSELVEGETLRAILDAQRLSLHKVLDLAVQLASGLAAAHARGIVHRDLKPDNILVSRDGLARIADFGLAKLREPSGPIPGVVSEVTTKSSVSTAEGAILGTIGYMAPEQVRGDPADARSDIFSFGCVLYEMAAGWRAFNGNRPIETLAAILRDDPPSIGLRWPSLPDELDRIVGHCLEKDAEQRFQSARDLVFALQAVPNSSSSVAVSRRKTKSFLTTGLGSVLGAGLSILRAILLTIP